MQKVVAVTAGSSSRDGQTDDCAGGSGDARLVKMKHAINKMNLFQRRR